MFYCMLYDALICMSCFSFLLPVRNFLMSIFHLYLNVVFAIPLVISSSGSDV